MLDNQSHKESTCYPFCKYWSNHSFTLPVDGPQICGKINAQTLKGKYQEKFNLNPKVAKIIKATFQITSCQDQVKRASTIITKVIHSEFNYVFFLQ